MVRQDSAGLLYCYTHSAERTRVSRKELHRKPNYGLPATWKFCRKSEELDDTIIEWNDVINGKHSGSTWTWGGHDYYWVKRAGVKTSGCASVMSEEASHTFRGSLSFVPRIKSKGLRKPGCCSRHSEPPSSKAGLVDNGTGFCSRGALGPSWTFRGLEGGAHSRG